MRCNVIGPETDSVSMQRTLPALDGPGARIEIDDNCYYRHPNGGGLVAFSAYVADTVFVGPDAIVKDRAIVLGNVRLLNQAVVDGVAFVGDECVIKKSGYVGGHAHLSGHVTVTQNGRVEGNAELSGYVRVEFYARIRDNDHMEGNYSVEG